MNPYEFLQNLKRNLFLINGLKKQLLIQTDR